MLKAIDDSLALLPAFVAAETAEYGAFQIQTIPAIDETLVVSVALLWEDRLAALDAILARTPELARWKPASHAARSDLETGRAVLDLIAKEDGIRQSTLGRRVGVPGKITARLVRWFEEYGVLRRKRSGKSWALHLTAKGRRIQSQSAPSGAPRDTQK